MSFEEKRLAVVPEGLELEEKIFSPDGRGVFFKVRKPDREFVVVGDKKGEGFDWVIGLSFNPDGMTVADKAKEGGKEFVVVGDRKGEEFEEVFEPAFSPDGRKVAFGALKGRELWWKVTEVK